MRIISLVCFILFFFYFSLNKSWYSGALAFHLFYFSGAVGLGLASLHNSFWKPQKHFEGCLPKTGGLNICIVHVSTDEWLQIQISVNEWSEINIFPIGFVCFVFHHYKTAHLLISVFVRLHWWLCITFLYIHIHMCVYFYLFFVYQGFVDAFLLLLHGQHDYCSHAWQLSEICRSVARVAKLQPNHDSQPSLYSNNKKALKF